MPVGQEEMVQFVRDKSHASLPEQKLIKETYKLQLSESCITKYETETFCPIIGSNII